ncbi:nucleoside 2-deoxyribosyltransferase [Weissella diestrammenae]|uniref:Nucleoside 2-deoxyribosyltransferase n=1 Tax=Weissella diestrammenae TaxID=1162633 RepID=A0A7G9T5Y7_9LACO|nr:nucleoside 2-deoxyribosyltransferase [Weissella diestrammenae]MCM0582344.1 nucleoside 2-deoxyribosyltransferase [Weissella diestrammenae]QNN75512.1 nucleoside 2-deoxyribosyltransferase [Weissella diestrammenae]
MTKVYLAGPFFDDEQIARLERVEAALQANPTVESFYSPFRDSFDDYEFGSKAWAKVVFESDRQHLHDADVVVGIVDYDQDYVDPGTAWELGYAGMQGKKVVIFKEKEGGINIMISVPAHTFIRQADQLATYDFNVMPASEWDGPVF